MMRGSGYTDKTGVCEPLDSAVLIDRASIKSNLGNAMAQG
jgi:hypothetical protein